MATLPLNRIFGLGSKGKGGPPVIMAQLATTGQPAVGAAGTAAGSVVTMTTTALATITANAHTTTTTTALGLLETRYLWGATPAANQFVPTTLLAPFYFYEGSIAGTGVSVGSVYTLANGTGNWAEVTTTTLNGVARILYFPGQVDVFRMNDFNTEAGTTAGPDVTGSYNQPHASSKGLIADTNARAVITFLPAFCIAGR